MSLSEKAPWVFIHATATTIDMEDFYFLAFPLNIYGTQCMKKAIQQSDNMWHCTKCKSTFLECDYHYVIRLQLHDHTGNLENYVAFDDDATELLGISAKDLHLLSSEPKTIHNIIVKVKCCHFLFIVSIRTDTFNGIERLLPTLMHSEEISYAFASALLLNDFKFISTPSKNVVR